MIVDKEEHRVLLLQMINGIQFPGSARDLVYEVGRAIETATVQAKPDEKAEATSAM